MNDNIPVSGRSHLSKVKLYEDREVKPLCRSTVLLSQIGRTIGVRYGGPCNDDDAAIYYEIALPYLIDIAIKRDRGLDPAGPAAPWLRGYTPNTIRWLRWCAPGLVVEDLDDPDANAWVKKRESEVIARWHAHHAMTRGAVRFPPGGRELGQQLRLTASEMRVGGIRFVTPIDRTPEQLRNERRARDAAYKQDKRDKQGARPQTSSIEALQLWTVLGMKRRRFYELKSAGQLPPMPKVPRGADPAPYLDAFAAAYAATPMSSVLVPLAA